MELIQMLVQQLGVSDEQASGGAGLLFKLAQEKLSSGEFAQVKDTVPGIENMMSRHPKRAGYPAHWAAWPPPLGEAVRNWPVWRSLPAGLRTLILIQV